MSGERSLPGVNQTVYVTYRNQEYRTFVLEARPPEFSLAYPFPYDVRPERAEPISVGFVVGSEYGSFPAEIVARSAKPLPSLLVRQTAEPSFTWRRGAFRLPVRLNALVEGEGGGRTSALAVDLSATGARLRLSGGLSLEVGQVVQVTLDLGEGSTFATRARVVRLEEAEERYAAVHFLPERLSDNDRLARWIFARQRELRRKGLL